LGDRPRRWNTRFGRFSARRLSSIAEVAGVRPHTIYDWISGRHDPEPKHARAIVRMSGGSITFNDIYGHRDKLEGNGDG